LLKERITKTKKTDRKIEDRKMKTIFCIAIFLSPIFLSVFPPAELVSTVGRLRGRALAWPVDGGQAGGEDERGGHGFKQSVTTMPVWPIIVVTVFLFIVLTLIPGVKHWRYRKSIHKRIPATAEWEAEFSSAMPTVENLLTIFCDAFLFDTRYRFHFRPDDCIADVYKGTTGPVADEMQFVRLAMKIRQSFGVDITSGFHQNTTLRDIVAVTLGTKTNA
jgi:hypothetical protein